MILSDSIIIFAREREADNHRKKGERKKNMLPIGTNLDGKNTAEMPISMKEWAQIAIRTNPIRMNDTLDLYVPSDFLFLQV